VAEAFIEQLETVQIDIQHRHVAAVAAHPLTGFLQPLLQQAAVGQPGEIVVMGQVAQTLLDLAPHAEVGDEGDHMGDAAVGITHLAQLHPLRIDLAALARLDQLALPVAVPLQRLAHGLVLPLALRRAGDTRHAVAEQFLAAVAGQRAAGVIHRQDTVAIVHDHDAFAGGLEHRGGQALLLGLTAQLADVTARADHAQRSPTGIALDHPAAVFEPEFAAISAQRPILHGKELGFTLQMGDQCRTDGFQIVGMDVRQRRAMLIATIGQADTEDHFQPGVVDPVVRQVPIPQTEAAGIERQIEPCFAFTEFFGGPGKLHGTFGHTQLEAIVSAAQLLLGMATLFDLRP